MNRPELPPILNTKEYQSLVEKYNEQEERQRKYCYKPYRTLHNYYMEMNDYSAPEYKDLYEEILIDYNWRYGKFSSIPYPNYTNCNQNEKQSIEISSE